MVGLTKALSLLGLGWYIVITLGLGFAAGRWLDGQFGIAPLLTIVGTIFGLVVAFVGSRRLILDVLRSAEKEQAD